MFLLEKSVIFLFKKHQSVYLFRHIFHKEKWKVKVEFFRF